MYRILVTLCTRGKNVFSCIFGEQNALECHIGKEILSRGHIGKKFFTGVK